MSRKSYQIAFFSWIIIILILTSVPDLNTSEDQIVGYDKFIHLTMYTVFAFLYSKMQSQKPIKEIVRSLLIMALLVPIADEVHQIPIPGRSFALADIIADILGFLIVILLLRSGSINKNKIK